MFLHKRSTFSRKYSSNCSWKLWWCLVFSIYSCCLCHLAYGQLPSALTTTPKPTNVLINTTTTGPDITKTFGTRVIVESIAVDERKKPINDNDEADEKTAAEIVQLPHAIRHQQHYSHRIEQAVNDFKQQQEQLKKEQLEEQKLQGNHLKERDKIKNTTTTTRKYEQQQQDQQHHQRRHEQHQRQKQYEAQQNLQVKQPLYHLRHRNHYVAAWEQQNSPILRHQHHRHILKTTATATTTTTSPIRFNRLQEPSTEAGIELGDNVDNGHVGASNNNNNITLHRYFDDRATVYRRLPVTKSPLKSTKWHTHGNKQHIKPVDAMYQDKMYNNLSGKRFALKIQDKDENVFRNLANEFNTDDNVATTDVDNNNNDDDVVGGGDDDDDDDVYGSADDSYYSDEQTDEDFFMSRELSRNENNFPTNKPPVKRFTNPFRNIFKTLRGSTTDTNKHKTNKNDEIIPDEKYRLRVQQHHIKQQQHQEELEAMRSLHVGRGNNVVSASNNNHKQQASDFNTVPLMIHVTTDNPTTILNSDCMSRTTLTAFRKYDKRIRNNITRHRLV